MICVSISEKTNDEAIKQIRAAEKIADAIEIRLDSIEEPDLNRLINSTKPIIATNRKKGEGGNFEGSEEERISLLIEAIKNGAEYADIELSSGKQAISKLIGEKGKARIIVSYHNFTETPESLDVIIDEISSTGCDIIKIAAFANDITDNIRMFEAAKKSGKNIIALCMGEKGEISRILYKKFGSILTYSIMEKGKETAPGQITIQLMKNLYRADKLNKETQILGTIGKPAKYSRSIFMFNPVYEKLKLNKVHLKFEVDNLAKFLSEIKKLKPAGFAVTTPYKEEVLKHLDEIDETAREIGAVNTIVVKDNKLIGYNTDGIGAKRAIQEKTVLEGKNIVIIGAGGAAKAVSYVLSKENCNLRILNRTVEKAKEIAKKAGCEYGSLNDLGNFDLLLNCTSVGMSPNESETPIEKKHLKGIVMDIVYKPIMTTLLKEAKEQRCETIDGISMLLHQGIEQYRLWMGIEPPIELMRESLWKSLSEKQ